MEKEEMEEIEISPSPARVKSSKVGKYNTNRGFMFFPPQLTFVGVKSGVIVSSERTFLIPWY